MPRIEITLPTLHDGQINIFRNAAPLNAVRCGRRFGKTKMMVTMAANAAAKGRKVGLFTPEHKQLAEPYRDLLWILRDVKKTASKTEGMITTLTGGQIDFWSLNDNELAGRGREYDDVMIDEGAFTKNSQMYNIWAKSINPTMLTKPNHKAWVFSTPNGNDPENFFYRICKGLTDYEFKEHYAPTSSNPYVPPDELERERRTNHPQIFLQEFLAEFVDWSGVAFFLPEKMLVDGQGVDFPNGCYAIGAVIDTAVKTGQSHDGTGVLYFAVMPEYFTDYRLVFLDWDIVQIEGALLERWIPSVFKRLDELSAVCRPLYGTLPVWIEDAASGSILLQQCAMRGYNVDALPSNLTSLGKDPRAINVSQHVWCGHVKFSQYAFEKRTLYKGTTANHLLNQMVGFRIGDKDAAKRADDLLDCATYSIAVTLGNSDGTA